MRVYTAAFIALSAVSAGAIPLGFRLGCLKQEASSPGPSEFGGLRFTAISDFVLSISQVGNPDPVSLQVSYDLGETWSDITIPFTSSSVTHGSSICLQAGPGGNATFSNDLDNFYTIKRHETSAGTFSASGDLNSLLNRAYWNVSSVQAYCFNSLFLGSTGLVDAHDLLFPDVTLGSGAYAGMFANCTFLERGPSELSARTLSEYCYGMMFDGCTKITSSPDIKATTLCNACFQEIFSSCSSLSTIKIAYTGDFYRTEPFYPFSLWTPGVAASGTLYYSGTDQSRGSSAIPTGWSVVPYQ